MKNRNKLIAAAAAAAILIIIIVIISALAGNKPTAKAGSVYDASSTLATYRTNSDWALKNLTEIYGFGSADADSVINGKEEWKAYSLDVEVNNKSKDDITIYKFLVEKNGKNDVWVSTVANGEIGIVSGNKEPIGITVLVKGKDVSAEDAAKAIKKFNIKIDYSKTPTENKEGVESIENHKTINVK